MSTGRLCIVGVACALLAACGHAGATHAAQTAPRSAAPAPSSTPMTRTTALPALPHGPTGPAHPAPRAGRPVAAPVLLIIPAIGVDTGLESLDLLPDGTLEPPHEWGVAGWYADGVRPGEPGPAVIAGHVDSVNGPAVFYRLHDLRIGATVLVRTRDDTMLRFVVDTVRRYPKTQFPTAAVYGPTPLPELRLVTCTGEFDWSARSYLDNLVVSARLV
jgi:Sortase domain